MALDAMLAGLTRNKKALLKLQPWLLNVFLHGVGIGYYLEGEVMTRLILIRHGETEYSLQKRYCGFSDPPLNENGIRQSERLFSKLKKTRVDRVYSSDLQRALQSARIIFRKPALEQFSDFREMDFGVLEGLRYEEIINIYPKLYRDWLKYPEEIKIPQGESLEELSKRVNAKLSSILSENKGKVIALVTHGGPIRTILCNTLRFDLKMFWQIKQEIGALNIIDYSDELIPAVVKMNDTSHLII